MFWMMLEPVQKNDIEVCMVSADSAPGVETEIAEWIEPSPRIWMTSSAVGVWEEWRSHQAGVAPLCLLTLFGCFYICLPNLMQDFWHFPFFRLWSCLVFREFPHLGLAQNLWRKGSLLPKQFLRAWERQTQNTKLSKGMVSKKQVLHNCFNILKG